MPHMSTFHHCLRVKWETSSLRHWTGGLRLVNSISGQSRRSLRCPMRHLLCYTFIPFLFWFLFLQQLSDLNLTRLDDIQDESVQRRGKPAAHIVYGTAQTINSATYTFMNAFSEALKLQKGSVMAIILGKPGYSYLHILLPKCHLLIFESSPDEIENLHCGQSFDLHWKYHTSCPTVDEYNLMVDNSESSIECNRNTRREGLNWGL